MPSQWQATAVAVDEAHSRVYALANTSEAQLVSFDLQTLEALAIMSPGLPSASVNTRMVSWGTDGLAIADGTRLVVLQGAFFTTYRGEAAQP
jgi:hypothetical protein